MVGSNVKEQDIHIGRSSFWILMITLSVLTLAFLLVQAVVVSFNFQVAMVAIIFIVLTFVGVILSRFKVFDLGTWGENTLAFTIGFFLYVLIGSLLGQQSIIGVNQLFASVASVLPQEIELVTNVFLIPIAEEMVWMIGLPFSLLTLMENIGKRKSLSIFKNGWFQLVILMLVCGVTFAIFHQGKILLSFIIGSIIFRSILIFLVYGDWKYDIIKGVSISAAFAVGAHIANNLMFRTIPVAWSIIMQNFFPIGILILLFFALLFGSAIEKIVRMINGKQVES